MATQALLFDPPRGIVVVTADAAALEETAARLPDGTGLDERVSVLTAYAHDAADAGATMVLVWQDGFEPFGLWIQLTRISDIGLARAFVHGEIDGWVGALHAPLIGTGVEWFSPASDPHGDTRWSAVFADDELFVNLTLRAASFSELVARRALVENAVLPSLVIAEDAAPWSSDETLAAGVIVASEHWPQLSSTREEP